MKLSFLSLLSCRARSVFSLAGGVAGGLMVILVFSACSGRNERSRSAYTEAVKALINDDTAKSLELFEKSLDLAPSGNGRAARIYNFMGVARWKSGDRVGAREAFEQSRGLNPMFSAPFYNLGLMDYLAGNMEDAVSMFSRAAMNDAHDLRSRDMLARIYRKDGRLDEAERVLQEALKAEPGSAMILTSMGLVALQKGDIDEAVELMRRALEKEPSYPPAAFNLGMIYMRRKDEPVLALKYFETYLENPDSESHERAATAIAKHLSVSIATSDPGEMPGVESSDIAATKVSYEDLLSEARVMARNGQSEAAVNVFLRAADFAQRSGNGQNQEKAVLEAVELFPDNARPYYTMARLLEKRNDTKKALEYCKKAATLSENWFDVQMLLARLARLKEKPT